MSGGTDGRVARPCETTTLSVVFGLVLAVVFGAANAYLGLKVGMTVSASIPAAVISLGMMRFVFRRKGVLESNLVQTIGSAGESIAAGAVFTLPAVFLWHQAGLCGAPGIVQMTLLTFVGGALGVLFMVPLRKSMIARNDAGLIFPEGRACAEVLKTGESRCGGAGKVFAGLGFGSAHVLLVDGLRLVPSAMEKTFVSLNGSLGLAPYPALAGVGYIVGPAVGLWLAAGSFLSRMVLVPVYTRCGDLPAASVWPERVKFVAVGAIACAGVLALGRAVVSMAVAWRGRTAAKATDAQNGSRDLSLKTAVLGSAALLVLAAVAPAVPFGLGGAAMIAVFGFLFSVVAVRITGIVGSSNSPVSGMTIATLLAVTALMKLSGGEEMATRIAALAVGSVVCGITSISGDTAQDLMTGRLVGASPRAQQIGELVGVASSSLAIGAVLCLLDSAWGLGSERLPAPQANLMKTVVEGVMNGGLPWGCVGVGAAIVVILELCRVPTMSFALGMYLPMPTMAAVFAGSLLRLGAKDATNGTLFSAGLVAGEGLAGLALAGLALGGLSPSGVVVDSQLGTLAAAMTLYGTLGWVARARATCTLPPKSDIISVQNRVGEDSARR